MTPGKLFCWLPKSIKSVNLNSSRSDLKAGWLAITLYDMYLNGHKSKENEGDRRKALL